MHSELYLRLEPLGLERVASSLEGAGHDVRMVDLQGRSPDDYFAALTGGRRRNPGTETWHSESRNLTTRDYRLFEIQQAVLPMALPLPKFHEGLVETQSFLAEKLADHRRPVAYELPEPPADRRGAPERSELYVRIPLRLRNKGAGRTARGTSVPGSADGLEERVAAHGLAAGGVAASGVVAGGVAASGVAAN